MFRQDPSLFYKPTKNPILLDIPPTPYLYIEGEGDPNAPAFSVAVAALYALTYAVKMSYKKPSPPSGYVAYKVFPLSGIWDLIDITKPLSDKTNYRYTLMIEQPAFLTQDLFNAFLEETQKKKPNPLLTQVKFGYLEEGHVCQMLHVGPYSKEVETFAYMEEYIDSLGIKRASKTHKEIYLSDPRRSSAEKCKTLLRFSVTK